MSSTVFWTHRVPRASSGAGGARMATACASSPLLTLLLLLLASSGPLLPPSRLPNSFENPSASYTSSNPNNHPSNHPANHPANCLTRLGSLARAWGAGWGPRLAAAQSPGSLRDPALWACTPLYQNCVLYMYCPNPCNTAVDRFSFVNMSSCAAAGRTYITNGTCGAITCTAPPLVPDTSPPPPSPDPPTIVVAPSDDLTAIVSAILSTSVISPVVATIIPLPSAQQLSLSSQLLLSLGGSSTAAVQVAEKVVGDSQGVAARVASALTVSPDAITPSGSGGGAVPGMGAYPAPVTKNRRRMGESLVTVPTNGAVPGQR
eukprot:XP_001694278.1 predicted protein [Chlamydomonas reinhardtii]